MSPFSEKIKMQEIAGKYNYMTLKNGLGKKKNPAAYCTLS